MNLLSFIGVIVGFITSTLCQTCKTISIKSVLINIKFSKQLVMGFKILRYLQLRPNSTVGHLNCSSL